jgi:hypothetical protein
MCRVLMAADTGPGPSPHILQVAADHVADSADSATLSQLITHIRSQSDSCIFLSGGASKMSDASKRELLQLFDALTILSQRGLRIAVGDGGTQAGIMEAAGFARRASVHAFPLLGVAPAPEIAMDGAPGKTPVDPNHSHIVAIRNDAWEAAKRRDGWKPEDGYWGSETEAMYQIFARLADGRPSITLVANGGDITLDEVAANVIARRPMVLIAGSGRAADVLVELLKGTRGNEVPPDLAPLAARAHDLNLAADRNRDLYRLFDLHAGACDLADLIAHVIAPPSR